MIPSEHLSNFLNDVAAFHRGGVRPYHDHGRTAGIGASGGAASGWDEKPDQHPDNDGGMIGELRALQRARGW
jgi:general stress protein YciG